MQSESRARTTTEVHVAAVQLEAETGAFETNVDRAVRYVREALEAGVDIVVLPEFFTTRVVLDERVWDAVRPAENDARESLFDLASTYDAIVGGSMLVQRGADVYNAFLLIGPNGHIGTHDKDIPTMWENAFYVGGDDDGVIETAHGRAGLAVCWELIRHRTLERLVGRVQFALTGNHWWTLPTNWPGFDGLFGSVGQYNRYLSENAPREFARALGVPVVHASHCGDFEGRFLLYPGDETGVPYRSSFVGATQIVDADGSVLASRHTDEGPGVVTATIDVPDAPPTDVPAARHTTDDFWFPNLTLSHRLYWHHQNVCGRAYYERNRDAQLQ